MSTPKIEINYCNNVNANVRSVSPDSRCARSLDDYEFGRAVWTPFWMAKFGPNATHSITFEFLGDDGDDVVIRSIREKVAEYVKKYTFGD